MFLEDWKTHKVSRNVYGTLALISLLPFALSFFLNIWGIRSAVYPYVHVYNILEIFEGLIGLSIFAIGAWGFKKSGDKKILFVALAFLLMSMVDLMPTEGMFISNQFVWLDVTGKTIGAVILLASILIIPPEKKEAVSDRVLATYITLFLILVASYSAITINYSNLLPRMIEGLKLTPLNVGLNVISALFFGLFVVVYLKQYIESRNWLLFYMIVGVLLLADSSITYIFVSSLYDAYWWISHMFQLGSFFVILSSMVFYISYFSTVEVFQKKTISKLQKDLFMRYRECQNLVEALEDKKGELAESEVKYRNLVENSNDFIFTVDLEGRFTFCNSKTKEITGYEPAALLGRIFWTLFDEKSAEVARNNFKNAMNGRPAGMYEVELITSTGAKKTLELNGTYIIRKGKVDGRQCIARDVTKRKKLERQLLQSEKLASIGRLASGVAHGINNPLANISLMSQRLLNQRNIPKPGQRKLKMINEQANIAANIVKNLLDFSRMSNLDKRQIDLNSLLHKILELTKHQFPDGKIKLVEKLDPSIPRILADSEQLHQVFVNIITNAVQAMPEGGSMEIQTRRRGSSVEVEISDSGYGIPKENLDKIFDPFFTTKGVGDGTGLGLSVSLGIVQKHNGTIEVESKEKEGTTFLVRLPRS